MDSLCQQKAIYQDLKESFMELQEITEFIPQRTEHAMFHKSRIFMNFHEFYNQLDFLVKNPTTNQQTRLVLIG